MKYPKLSRRTFALSIGSGVALSSFNLLASSRTHPGTELNTRNFVSAATDPTKQHWLVIMNDQGEYLHKLALPGRAHQIAVNSQTHVLAIAARRPGTYLMIVDANNGQLLQEVHPESGHHFYGHSAYSLDGKLLFTTENHIDSGEGRVFVRDALANYKILTSFSSHGVGPHEIRVHPDGKTLILANGGILTHPESGRAKLNLDTMSPSLVYLSSETGAVLELAKLPDNLHQLSIRHIDINQEGAVAIAMQYQGDITDNVPLIGVHKRGGSIKTLWAPDHINRSLQNYCGSVCYNQSGSIFAVSSPRGDTVTLWDAIEGEFITHLRCPDVCGISQSDKHGFTFSNGLGKLYQLDLKQMLLKPLETHQKNLLALDNHLSMIG